MIKSHCLSFIGENTACMTLFDYVYYSNNRISLREKNLLFHPTSKESVKATEINFEITKQS